jgi:hypothetical protein
VEFNLVPVDFAADVIVKIAKHKTTVRGDSGGGTFHVNNFSHATTFETLLEGVRRFATGEVASPPTATALEAMTYLAWRKKIDASDENNPLFVVRSMFHSWYLPLSLSLFLSLVSLALLAFSVKRD